MLNLAITAALILGLVAWRIGLPPLVGFLLTGFLLSGFGVEAPEFLDHIAEAGVLMLLFSVGLKVRVKTLFRKEVWGSAATHLAVLTVSATGMLVVGSGLAWEVALILAVALAFSSTVLAAKVLETHKELRAVHGRIAIGILIVQDLAAVAALAFITTRSPSPYAALWLGLPLLRPILSRVLDVVGHDELLVLYGAVVAIAIGGAGFSVSGLTPELGALLLGTLLADHRRAQELSKALWGLKELFLVGFFLSIGLSGVPTWQTLELTAWALLILPIKVSVLFALLIALGLRARTSFLTSISLATYSEFGLIVIKEAVDAGSLSNDWLIVAGLTVAISFVVAALLNANGHRIFERYSDWLERWETDKRHPDDEPISLGSAEMLIVGMGRVGTGAYDYLHDLGELVVGMDTDPGKLEAHRKAGRRVVYADAEDASFWQRLHIDRLRVVMVAAPDLNSKLIAGRELTRRGYAGLLTATHIYSEDEKPILEAGYNASYNYFTESGVGFARDIVESLEADQELESN